MKKLLGSLLLLSLSLFARSGYEWQVSLSEQELYLHQSTLLRMKCTFAKEGKNDDVEFRPPAHSGFEFILLGENRHFDGDIQTLSYEYLLFAKEEGQHELQLKPQMLFTTQSAIDNVIIGRDNVNDLEVEKETAKIPVLQINVKATDSELTGRFSMTADLDTQSVSAYEPVHLAIKIEGVGNLQVMHDLNLSIEGVDVFADAAEQKYELSEEGYKGSWSQRFAFVGKESFTIPSISIAYFDLNTRSQKLLQTKAFVIDIKEDGIKREELIDEVNAPSQAFDIGEYLGYLYYLLSFIAGFIVAKLFKLPAGTPKKEKGSRIKQAKTPKELLETLVMCDSARFEEEIDKLEGAVYKGNNVELSLLKTEALKKL